MKKDRLILVALIVLVLLNLTSWGLYWFSTREHMMPPPRKEEPGVLRSERLLSRKLNFSESQENELKKLQKKHFREMQNLQQRHHMVRKEFVKMAMGSSYDSLMADSLFQVMTIVNGEMQKKTWLHFRDIYELCDKTQKNEFRRIMLRLNKLNSRRKFPPLSRPH
jgi:hypothetical protein